ncbi:four-carbon acid sugar kinase family protein [Prosthecobacter sp.]|uniref:four-carbon acid sugar kinase family protein n=1 Tax=Prosthecobacter sp. TaxID=1965333 RepID=UPI001D53245E|nr:four-carbon acid sugar kinase family protein [Prosthecobacter sp.]MCB1276742.1 four-carbon acid sugar kinase family protein [Prosthecobacter sp.]
MITIIADDFSGAAELAGIAAAHGFKAEVQTQFDPGTDAEVVAVDTDTRLKSEDEAARIVGEITRQIVAAKPTWIYKKTDSVLRGHIRAEIEAILAVTGQQDCCFVPANPSKGRIVVDGRYWVNGMPLNETVFAQDPDHPRRSAVVRELLGRSTVIHTPDVRTREDLGHTPGAGTLAAGAADFFTELIGGSPVMPVKAKTQASLLVCGSLAAWEMRRAEEMQQRGFVVKTIDEPVSPAIWQTTSRLMLAIGPRRDVSPEQLTAELMDAALPLIDVQPDLRIGLEGGATAMAFIRRMGWTRFEVVPEGFTGVGSLRPPGGPLFCVKPGSYPWPDECFACQD